MLEHVLEHVTGSTFIPIFGRKIQFLSGGEMLRYYGSHTVFEQKVSFSGGECVSNALQCREYPD